VGSGSDDQTAAEILAALITVDGASSDLDADLLDGISSATFALDTDVDDLSGVSDASTARTNLGLEVGTDVQAFNSNLTTYAGITPTANTQSFLAAVNYATMRGLLDLEAGTDFYAMSAADTAFEGELDDSAGLAGALSDETGTGNAVFSTSPTLTGTLDAVAGDFSATLTMSGSLANIALGSNFLSGDGDDEGVFVNSDGNVGIGTTTPGSLLTVAGNMELTGFFYDSAGSSGIFGDVLQRGSSGLTWVATSTLGIGGAGEDDTVVSQTFTSSSTWHALTGLSASTTVGVTLDTTNLVTGSLSLVVDGATTTVLAGTTFVGLVVANSTVSVVAEESDAFDVSTASFVDSFDVSGQDANPLGLAFSPDGLKMFVVGTTGQDINEYTLATVISGTFTTSASALITTEGDFGGADLAELYPVTDTNIAAGDIVSFIDNDSFALTYATAESSYALAGVVSTDPGITLSDSTEGREAVPLALSGRVPVKVNLEGGLIVPGDRITPSSVPGVGRKATLFEPSIGTALTAYNPENPDEQQLVTVFVRLEEGVNVYNLTDTLFAGASTTFMMPLATTFSTTTGTTTETVTITENIAVSIWNRLADLASRFVDGVLTLAGLKAEKVETVELETTKLCIGNTCVDEDTLRALLQSADLVNSGSEEDSEIDTETDEETSSENQQEDEDIESSDSDTNDIVDTPTNSSEDTDTADIVDTPTNSSEDTDTASQDDFATTTNTYISTETPTTSTDNIPEETDNTTQIIEETPRRISN